MDYNLVGCPCSFVTSLFLQTTDVTLQAIIFVLAIHFVDESFSTTPAPMAPNSWKGATIFAISNSILQNYLSFTEADNRVPSFYNCVSKCVRLVWISDYCIANAKRLEALERWGQVECSSVCLMWKFENNSGAQ